MTHESNPSAPQLEAKRITTSMNFTKFLEDKHPSVEVQVSDLWKLSPNKFGYRKQLLTLPIKIHCWGNKCEGLRFFRCEQIHDYNEDSELANAYVAYVCGDCKESTKYYSLIVRFGDNFGGAAYKYGEKPAFGVPVSNAVLRLFGKDGSVFKKGRSCEAQGLGIGAFAYYRQMVEAHKSKLFDDVISACSTLSAPQNLIDNLKASKNQYSFSKAMDEIKPATPEGLLINGHNPLLLLHAALSAGLHAGTDEECLQAAQDVRLVLTELVDRLSQIKKDDAALNSAVHRLIAKASAPVAK